MLCKGRREWRCRADEEGKEERKGRVGMGGCFEKAEFAQLDRREIELSWIVQRMVLGEVRMSEGGLCSSLLSHMLMLTNT